MVAAACASALALAGAARAQGSISGTVHDSLGGHRALKGATVVLVERATFAATDSAGHFHMDDVPPGHYSLGLMHPVLDSFDLVPPLVAVEVADGRSTDVTLATPSAASAYQLGCARRLADVKGKDDVLRYLRRRAACMRLAAWAEWGTSLTTQAERSSPTADAGAQILNSVMVRDSAPSPSPMSLSGFFRRRQMGLGIFVADSDFARHGYQTLAELLASVRGVHVEYGTYGQPTAYLRGNKEGYCIPTFFVDGMVYDMPRAGPALRPTESNAGHASRQAFRSPLNDLSAMASPNMVREIEVYPTPGTIPAEYDLTSSTGCGSIVIWTR